MRGAHIPFGFECLQYDAFVGQLPFKRNANSSDVLRRRRRVSCAPIYLASRVSLVIEKEINKSLLEEKLLHAAADAVRRGPRLPRIQHLNLTGECAVLVTNPVPPCAGILVIRLSRLSLILLPGVRTPWILRRCNVPEVRQHRKSTYNTV